MHLLRFAVISLACTLAAASVSAAPLRAIADVASVTSYRMEAQVQIGNDPPLQGVHVEGRYVKEPEAYQIEVRLSEGSNPPVPLEARKVGGTLYFRSGKVWGEVERFHLGELVVVTPEQLLGIADLLEDIGRETMNGREVLHLRGDKEDLPDVESGSESMDFSRMESAEVDFWVDVEENFIVRMEIDALAKERGQTLPLTVVFDYSEFGQAFQINTPADSEVVRDEPPRSSSPDEVTETLGFPFPIPEGGHASIYGGTVSILSRLPLDAARVYAHEAMESAGFRSITETERAPGEFFTDYEKEGRTLGVLVFQVVETGATIQVNALR